MAIGELGDGTGTEFAGKKGAMTTDGKEGCTGIKGVPTGAGAGAAEVGAAEATSTDAPSAAEAPLPSPSPSTTKPRV